jgi:CRP/FNR family transcriptional regulator
MDLIEIISRNPIFSKLPASERQRILRIGIARTFEKDQYISLYGDIWPHIFIVQTGSVKAVKESIEGRSLIVGRFESGDVFWGLAFFLENAQMPAALIANTKSKLHIWSRDQLLPIIWANGVLSWELMVMLVKRVLLTSDIVEGLAFQSVASRLARFLVTEFEEEHETRINRSLTLDEMAAHIGTTREMVSRVLNKFSSQELIDITRTEFVFRDRDELIRLAQTGNSHS